MAFAFYFNMEKLSFNIVEEMMKKMTDNNYSKNEQGESYLSCDIENNLKYGTIIISSLDTFLESFLNTIISNVLDLNESHKNFIYKISQEEKIKEIYYIKSKELSQLNKESFWRIYKNTENVRNGMIHFKEPLKGVGTILGDFEIRGNKVGEFFSQSNMQKSFDAYIKLSRKIALDLEIFIYEDVEVIECDGYRDLSTYVNKRKIHDNI